MNDTWIVLLFLSPVFGWLFFRLARYKKKKIAEYFEQKNCPKGFFEFGELASVLAFAAKASCFIAAWALTCTAMLLPPSHEQAKNEPALRALSPHLDIVFVLDCSSSMLATDTSTSASRYMRAKEIIETCIENLGGINVALIAFGASAETVVPLTEDYLYFRILLDSLNVNEYTTPGTSLSVAIQAINAEDSYKTPKMVVLLTDGEDTSGGLKEVPKFNPEIHLEVIGLGSEAGAVVPEIRFEGEQVVSKMQKKVLQMLAHAGSGRFYEEQSLSLLSLVDDLLADYAVLGSIGGKVRASAFVERIPIFPIISAFFLLLFGLILPKGRVKA